MKIDKLKSSNLSTKDFEWLQHSYTQLDSFNLDGFASILADDVSFQMGNNPVVTGKEEILKNVAAFWSSIHSMNHNFINVFSVEKTIILEAHIDYEKKDGKIITIPCITIIDRNENGLATSNRIFIDMSPLFN
jgi:hypothetical protein